MGSGSRKPIKIRDHKAIKKRDRAHILALTNPGSTVQAAFLGVNVGVSVELPGNAVTNVAYTDNIAGGDGSLAITTDVGTTTFSDVQYGPQAPTGWIASHDATTGLEDITFTASKSTTFTASDAASSGPDAGDYLWSDPLNWSNGVPVNGDNVVIASGEGVDDIASLTYLDGLTYGPRPVGDTDFRGVSVDTSLTIADAAGGDEDYIYTGTGFSQTGTVTIDSIGGTGGLGLDALTGGDTITVVASSDPNVQYSSAGLLVTNSTPGADGWWGSCLMQPRRAPGQVHPAALAAHRRPATPTTSIPAFPALSGSCRTTRARPPIPVRAGSPGRVARRCTTPLVAFRPSR
jgi:hypothetical protein